MMTEHDGIHPDESSIHAWLDDALGADEATRVEVHVAACAECAARVAEARGLIAGASRIVRLLDDAPAPLLVPAPVPVAATRVSRWLRVTPARAAIAATLIVAIGLTLTRDKVAVESGASAESALVDASSSAPAPVADAVAETPAAQAAQTPMGSDSVLASAVARRIRQELPQRTIGGAAGVTVPVAPLPPTVASGRAANLDAARKVAVGRDSVALSEVVVTASSADKVQAVARDAAAITGAGCYRLESRDGVGSWVGLPLPTEIALGSTLAPGEQRADARAPSYAITAVGGGAAIGRWTRAAGDTIALELRSSFATTTGFISGSGSSLTGTLQASAVGNSGAPAAAAAPARGQRQAAESGANTVRVVMRSMACPR